MQNFRDLAVWQKGHALTLGVYELTRSFPADELYGLTAQMRRASAGIGANITEGCGRGSDADFARFLQIAMGSASELEYHILLARDLGLAAAPDQDRLTEQVIEVKRMLASLIKKLRADS